MVQATEYRQKLIEEYKQEVIPLLRYVPWLEEHSGKPGSTNYRGQGFTEHTMSFPVYDSTLMSFIRDASGSVLMDRNYNYVYTRKKIRNHEDERKLIAAAGVNEWDTLRGILSKYVLGGRTRSILWSKGVQERIFLLVLEQMRKIIEYWDKPM